VLLGLLQHILAELQERVARFVEGESRGFSSNIAAAARSLRAASSTGSAVPGRRPGFVRGRQSQL
jgi:hypothetical protein